MLSLKLKDIGELVTQTCQTVVLEDSKNGILASYTAHIPVICIPDLVKHTKDTLDKTYMVLERLDQVIDHVGKR